MPQGFQNPAQRVALGSGILWPWGRSAAPARGPEDEGLEEGEGRPARRAARLPEAHARRRARHRARTGRGREHARDRAQARQAAVHGDARGQEERGVPEAQGHGGREVPRRGPGRAVRPARELAGHVQRVQEEGLRMLEDPEGRRSVCRSRRYTAVPTRATAA